MFKMNSRSPHFYDFVLTALLCAALLLAGCASEPPAARPVPNENPSATRQNLNCTVRDAYDAAGNKYINYAGQRPSLMTFVNADGSVTVCAAAESAQDTYIYEYSKDMALIKTMKFPNEREMLGAFTRDGEGNYYFFYGESVGSDEKDRENMAMVKYDPSGGKQKTYTLKANAEKSFDGIQKPFEASTCRLELSGSMLAVYFARIMFNGHQASYGFILNKDTFERVDKGATVNPDYGGNMVMPYVSHSFNQFILPLDGGFLFADHGDAYPRSFSFAKFLDQGDTKRLHAFQFEGGVGQNATYAELGGLAKTSSGYIFTGTYGYSANKSRNVFVLTFDDNLSVCGEPLWLTDYAPDTGHAAHPKITALDEGRYLLLWELCDFSTQPANQVPGNNQTGYKSTHMLIVDEQGKAVTPIKELPGLRLNMNDTLRYNRTTGKVYWSVNHGKQTLLTYALDPNQPIAFKTMELEASPGDFQFTVEGQGASRSITITKYIGSMGKLIIPAAMNDIPVTAIGTDAFRQSKLSTVVIPSSVTVIRSGAFTYADIAGITLSSGLTVIEDNAFWYSSITTMVIPSGVTTIGKQAFSNCPNLASITLPATAVNIGNFAFSNCKKLTTMVIPPAITQVGYGAFSGCDNLAPAVRSDLMSRFGSRAFGQ
jgi:hypothetical protein